MTFGVHSPVYQASAVPATRSGSKTAPSVSVVMATQAPSAAIGAWLEALDRDATRTEVIVVVPQLDRRERLLARRFPNVRFLEAGPGATLTDLRRCAIRRAAGDVVVFADTCWPPAPGAELAEPGAAAAAVSGRG